MAALAVWSSSRRLVTTRQPGPGHATGRHSFIGDLKCDWMVAFPTQPNRYTICIVALHNAHLSIDGERGEGAQGTVPTGDFAILTLISGVLHGKSGTTSKRMHGMNQTEAASFIMSDIIPKVNYLSSHVSTCRRPIL